jgi:hypothetical protein
MAYGQYFLTRFQEAGKIEEVVGEKLFKGRIQ